MIEFRLSGGASNAVGNASLGGTMSSTQAFGSTLGWQASSIAGVTLKCGFDVETGAALLFDKASNQITYTPPGVTPGTLADDRQNNATLADGFVNLNWNGLSSVTADIVTASLPASNQTATLTYAKVIRTLFDDIVPADVMSQQSDYRCIYVRNAGAVSRDVQLYRGIGSVMASFEIGFDAAGPGGTATTVVNELTAPSGVTFSQTNAFEPLLVTLASAQAVGLWIRRRTRPLVNGTYPGDGFTLMARVG